MKSELEEPEVGVVSGTGEPAVTSGTDSTPTFWRKFSACALSGIGAFSLTVAVLVPTYAADRLKKLPIDVQSATVSTATGADVLDSASTARGKPETDHDVPVRIQVYVTSEDPSDGDVTTLQAASKIMRIDRAGDGLISASVDRVTLDRSTALPVSDPVATTLSVADKPPVETPREGVQYKFPFDTQKTSYPYYDTTARQTNPIDYVDDDRAIDGMQLYHFRQQLGPLNLGESIGKDATLTLPASSWGLPGNGLFTMNLFYATTRDVWVEPVSGAVVAVEEQPHRWLARTASDPLAVTSFAAHTQFDEETIANLARTAHTARQMIQWGTVYLPIFLGVVGLTLVGSGVLVTRRR